ncbi:hypothetical protein [Neogemmobacter tilapiae]|uniref:Uncharacterized protein n=1 Tax=Neogemmobacter tilapiae TaxID=875041 RepID=A0A918TN97_9RHOB|nr:hypothetical protein [Gemmobacter tilapiae]GHC55851.1 hypothetical protein GCM10007315_18810 [Gemmobacter tilapiae]
MTPDWRDYLDPDERLVWTGKPRRSYAFLNQGDALSFLVGIFVVLIYLALIASSVTQGEGARGAVVALAVSPALMLFGWASIGRTLLRMRYLSHTAYAITDKRAVVFCGHPVPILASYSARKGEFHWKGSLFPSILFTPKFEAHLAQEHSAFLPLLGRKDYFLSCNPMLLNGFFDLSDRDGALKHIRAIDGKEAQG